MNMRFEHGGIIGSLTDARLLLKLLSVFLAVVMAVTIIPLVSETSEAAPYPSDSGINYNLGAGQINNLNDDEKNVVRTTNDGLYVVEVTMPSESPTPIDSSQIFLAWTDDPDNRPTPMKQAQQLPS